MNKFDKSWAQLQHQSDDLFCLNPFAPKPIKPKRSPMRRTIRTVWLFVTTKYSWTTSWHVAGV